MSVSARLCLCTCMMARAQVCARAMRRRKRRVVCLFACWFVCLFGWLLSVGTGPPNGLPTRSARPLCRPRTPAALRRPRRYGYRSRAAPPRRALQSHGGRRRRRRTLCNMERCNMERCNMERATCNAQLATRAYARTHEHAHGGPWCFSYSLQSCAVGSAVPSALPVRFHASQSG